MWTKQDGFTILPNPPGVIFVGAHAINEVGDIVGTVLMSSGSGGPPLRPFKWSRAGGFTLLPGADANNSYATDLDDEGNVVGYTEAGPVRSAVIWSDSSRPRSLNVSLPYLPAVGIHAGWIFGNAIVPDPLSGFARSAPYRMDMQSGRFVQLQARSEEGGAVLSVNRLGEAAGIDGNFNNGFGGSSDAVLWDQAGTQTIVFSCNGKEDCFASLNGINANGTTVGTVKTGELEPVRSFRWSRATGFEYLADPSGVTNGISVVGLNDDGSILASTRQVAFIIQASGPATILRPPAGYSLVLPWAMNRHGEVVGMLF